MRFRRSVSAWLVFVLSASGTAAAQDAGKVGITMAFPASLGVIFHATDAVAIRPEFSFARNTTEGAAAVETKSWTLGTGVSALFYLHSYDHVRTYVSPRYGYTRASASASSGLADTTVKSWSVTGSFGTEYTPTPKFSVFGEIGVGYTRQNSEPGINGFNLKASSTATRAGVGIIFYP